MTEEMDAPQFLQDLPPQFEPLRSFLEANLQPYIKIKAGEAVGSSCVIRQHRKLAPGLTQTPDRKWQQLRLRGWL